MNKPFAVYFASFLLMNVACSQNKATADRAVGDACDACELMFEGMPASLSPETRIAPLDEPGGPLLISGVIYQKDGKTPASDVILYVYHTNNNGTYARGASQRDGKRHGHLRGWMKTNAQGEYKFRTIRPAAYPSRKAPQHIHPLIKEPYTSPYWIDEYLFDDDSLLTTDERARQQRRGGPGIIHLGNLP